MNIILDTCTFLYAVLENEKLSKVATELIENVQNRLYLSSISAYEIVVKYKTGKLVLKKDPAKTIPEYRNKLNIIELPVSESEILHISTMHNLHKDPFDRIIIAQGLANDYFILTPDKLIHDYQNSHPIKIIW